MFKRSLLAHVSKLGISAVLGSPKPKPETFSQILKADGRNQGKTAKRKLNIKPKP